MLRRHFLYCVPLLPTAMMPQRSPSFAAGTRGRYLDFGPGEPFSPEKLREFQASIEEVARQLKALLKTLPQTEDALLNVVTPTYK